MKKGHFQIGDSKLLSFKIEEGWTKEQLCDKLIDKIAADGGVADLSKGMGKFYLKIKGYRDERIIPEELYCLACPRRSTYRMYDDYNGLKEIKQPVLVLVSDYIDFREYSIMCSYYTDKEDEKFEENIELWGDKLSIWSWLKKKTGYRA